MNYRREDLAKEVIRLTEGHGVDVVFENIGDATLWPGAFNSLAAGGRLVTAAAVAAGAVAGAGVYVAVQRGLGAPELAWLRGR